MEQKMISYKMMLRTATMAVGVTALAAACSSSGGSTSAAASATQSAGQNATTTSSCGPKAGGTSGSAGASSAATAAGSPAPPQSLVSQAKQEGNLVIYTTINDATTNSAIEADFEAAYPGIKVNQIELSAGSIDSRVEAEAAAGDAQSDILIQNYTNFFPDALSKGYILNLNSVIPGFKSVFPAAYVQDNGGAAVATIVENGFAYNTQLATGANVPACYSQFAQPFWKGKLITPDPNQDVAALEFWNAMLQTLGAATTEKIAANVGQSHASYDSFAPALAALGAGEGAASVLASPTSLQSLISAGAPVKYVLPEFASGSENSIGVTSKGPNPAAGKLFAYWATSKAGQTALAKAVGGSAPLDLAGTTSQYVAPNYAQATSAAVKQQIDSMLHESS
jgi:iron(III) transport system substrate-binding protein